MTDLPRMRASAVPYSSIVGGGVLLHAENGMVLAQIGVLHHTDTFRDRDKAEALYAFLVEAINAAAERREAGGRVLRASNVRDAADVGQPDNLPPLDKREGDTP